MLTACLPAGHSNTQIVIRGTLPLAGGAHLMVMVCGVVVVALLSQLSFKSLLHNTHTPKLLASAFPNLVGRWTALGSRGLSQVYPCIERFLKIQI